MTKQNHWQTQHKADVAFATATLMHEGEVAPMFVLHTKNAATVYSVPWDGEEDKRVSIRMLAIAAAATGADAVTFIGEAWLMTVPKFSDESEAQHMDRIAAGPRPSEAESRREVVIVSTTFRTDDGKSTLLSAMDIERNAAGRAVGLITNPPEEDSTFAGRLADILTDEPVPERLRPAVQALYERMIEELGMSAETIHPAGHA